MSIRLKSPRVAVIVVTYQSESTIRALLTSVQETTPEPLEWIIVDNASQDTSVDWAAAECPTAHIIANSENLGFAKAANQGAAIAKAPYLYFLNPDLEAPGDIVTPLSSFLDQHPEAAGAGPRLVWEDGRLQPSRGVFPTLPATLAYLADLKKLMPDDEAMIAHAPPFVRSFFGQYRPLTPIEWVDYVTGAALMFRRSLFEQLGGFDERFFLYYEEIDLCRRAFETGFRIAFLSKPWARHKVAASTPAGAVSPRYHRIKSLLAYYEKWHPGVPATLVRQAIYAAGLGRFLWSRVKEPEESDRRENEDWLWNYTKHLLQKKDAS